MPWKLTTFDGLTLPTSLPALAIGTSRSIDTSIPLPHGGVYDAYGSERAPKQFPYELSYQTLLTATSDANLSVAYNEICAKRGVRGDLYRTTDNGDIHYCQARLLDIEGTRSPGNNRLIQLELLFQVFGYWYNSYEYSVSIPLGGSLTQLPLNQYGTSPTDNAVITISPGNVALTSITLLVSGVSSFTYGGTIAANKLLIVDCGAFTALNDSVDVSTLITTDNYHTILPWLRLNPGTTNLELQAVGGMDVGYLQVDYRDALD